MKLINTIFVLLTLSALCTSSTAQVVRQNGIVRKITHSKTDPFVPVEGIRVIIDGISSSNSNAKGRFSISLKRNGSIPYSLDDVRVPKNKNFILAYPELKSKIYASKNDIVIAMITPDEQERISKENYNRLFRKYRQQGNELTQERNRLENLKMELSESDARYKEVAHQLDSVQKTLNYYFDNSKKRDITAELKRIAMELTMTDYQSLDSIDAELYDLKLRGEWAEISKLLNKIMKGDAAAYMREGIEKQKAAEALYKVAEQNLQHRLRVLEHAADSFAVLNIPDSVSKYYALLVDADSTNIRYLVKAARYESNERGNYSAAIAYLKMAEQYTEGIDKAKVLVNMAEVCVLNNKYSEAALYYDRAEEIYIKNSDSEMLHSLSDSYREIADNRLNRKDNVWSTFNAMYKRINKVIRRMESK